MRYDAQHWARSFIDDLKSGPVNDAHMAEADIQEVREQIGEAVASRPKDQLSSSITMAPCAKLNSNPGRRFQTLRLKLCCPGSANSPTWM